MIPEPVSPRSVLDTVAIAMDFERDLGAEVRLYSIGGALPEKVERVQCIAELLDKVKGYLCPSQKAAEAGRS